MKKMILFVALLIAGCDVFDLAPEIFVNYIVGNRDPKDRQMIARLFSADGGYITSSPTMPAGNIWQEQRTIASIDERWYNKRRDVTVQVVWTISLVLPNGRDDSLVASRDMQLVHGRTAQVMWIGRLELRGKSVPILPIGDDTFIEVVEITDKDRSAIHDQLAALLNR